MLRQCTCKNRRWSLLLGGTLGVAFMLAPTGKAGADPIQWNGNGHYYEIVSAPPGGLTWAASASEAAGRTWMGSPGHLVTITSSAEQSWVWGVLGAPAYSCLGGYQVAGAPEPAGGWHWITGEAWDYTHWGSGEPNNAGGNEDVVMFHPNGTWNDYPGSALYYHYVVEYEPEHGLPMFEIVKAEFSQQVYQNGVDTAHLTVVTRSNWGTSSDLRIDASVNRYDGMPYHLGTDTFALSPGQQRISSFSFSLPFLEVPADFGGLAVLSADGEIVAMHPTSSFTGTPLSVEERTAQVEYLEGCRILPEGSGLIAEVGGAATHGTLASPLLSGAGATISILENTCREEAYRASGDECRANVSAGIVGIGMAALSVAVFATVVVSAGATLPLAVAWVGVGLSALSGATAIVGESTIAGWFCDDGLVKLVRRADLPIGEGDRARSLLDHVGEMSDSTGVSFSIHTVIEGPVSARMELPVGYISRDSTSLYDAAAMVLAPDTLQWLAVGPSAGRFSLGLDSLAAPTDSLWPKTLDLMATGAGPVFLGIALRAVGSTSAEVLYYPSVQVTDSTRMSVVIGDYGGFFPLEVDYDGDGVVDEYLFPEGPSTVEHGPRDSVGPAMSLFPPHPNPTTGGATISLVATTPLSGVEIGIYDVAGRRVRRLAVGDIPPGVQQVVWEGRADDGRQVTSGIYYCVAECARGGTATIRLVVLR